MFDLGFWLFPSVTENDPADFKMPYRVHGKLDRELMLNRYMRLDNVEKPTIVYPGIANLLQ
jgi:hypothetical protein